MLSLDDQQLVDRDRELPGLSTLLDPEQHRGLLARLNSGCERIDNIQCVYLRYKPGVNCLAAYKASWQSGRQLFYAKAVSHDLGKSLRNGEQSAVRNRGLFVDTERSIVLRAFPDDRRLPALRAWIEKDSRRHLLARACANNKDLHEGDWSLLRYKPERRFVASIHSGTQQQAIVKIYERAEYERAWRTAKSFAKYESPRLPEVAGHSKRHRVIVWRWLLGTPLDQAMDQGIRAAEHIEAAGTALARFHQDDRGKIGVFDHGIFTAQMAAAAQTVSWLCPELTHSIQQTVTGILAGLADGPYNHTAIHGDFSGDQIILLDNGEIAFIDLDNASTGDPASDLGNFLGCLERDTLLGRYSQTQLADYHARLRRGYQQAGQSYHDKRVVLHTAAALIRLASESFRHRVPNWRSQCVACVHRARTIYEQGKDVLPATKTWNTRSTAVTAGPTRVSVEDTFGIRTDASMPWAPAALDPTSVERHFSRAVKGAPATNPLQLRSIRVIRHKPGRRCLVRYTVGASGEMERTTTLLGKIRAKGLDLRTFRLQQYLWHSKFGDQNEDGICVPRPVGTVPAWKMWLQTEVPGQRSGEALAGPDGILLAPRIAESIGKLHQSSAPVRRTHTLVDELRILRDCLLKVRRLRPDWEQRVTALVAACDRLGSTLETRPPCLIHRDFYPDQLLVHGNQLYLLDLDLACYGDPALDIGNFVGHLVEQSLRETGTCTAFQPQQHILVDAFCSRARANIERCIDAYVTLTLARHVYISTLFPDRREATPLILDHCEQRLGLRRQKT